jgi:uncharacterized protein involved in outer membrane biogenesis
MTKRRWILLGTIAMLFVVVPIAFVVFVATFDWNRAKPWLEARAGHALGRDIEIGGDVEAVWRWRRRIDGTDTFAPGFGLIATSVQVGNPTWATRKRFAALESLDIDFRLLPLLWHRIDIPAMRLIKPSIDFEQRKDGSNTWTFVPADKDESSAWKVAIGEVAFDTGEVTITDQARDLDVRATITRLDAEIPFGQHGEGDEASTRRTVIERVGRAAAERLRKAAEQRTERMTERGRERKPTMPYVFAWKASGTLHGDKVTGSGRIGGVLALEDPKPFPVRADIDVGPTQIALTGTITDPTSPDALDMRLWITGPNLARLYAITGITLPQTPPYATVGRLAGRFRPHRSVLRYQDFTARVGGSDLAGTLNYASEGERPTLKGNVDSTLLQFRDLGTLIGAAPAGDATSDRTPDRVLPSEPFDVEHWKAMDADVHFTGKRVVRTEELPINDVDTRVRMDAGVMTLDPLRFGMAGGNVKSSIRIDANATPPKGLVAIDARGLKLHRLFEKFDGLSQSPGEVNGDVKLAGSGNSIAGLLGNSDGALRVLVTEGRVSETLMEKAGLNFANVLLAKMRGDRQIGIDCAAAALTVTDGIAKSDLFVFDTENALVEIDGTIDLSHEHIDLTMHPHTKGMRVFSLRSPLHAEGNFEALDVSVDKKSLFARGGGAIGLGIVAAPLAALLPLVAPGNNDDAKSCTPLVDTLKKNTNKAPSAPEPKNHASPDHPSDAKTARLVSDNAH